MAENEQDSNFSTIIIVLIIVLLFVFFYILCERNPIICLIEMLSGGQPSTYNINTAFGIV